MERMQLLCFAGTYALALASDLARVVVRSPVRWYATVSLTSLGLAVHTAYLANLAIRDALSRTLTVYESLLVVAWLLAATGLYLIVRAPRQAAVGVFVLPVVLALLGIASQAPKANWADWGGWTMFWGTTHGLFLLGGAAAACVAFVASAMYLIQSRRLKQKRSRLPRFGFVFLSLEQSERVNRGGVAVAFPLLTIGIAIGMALQWAVGVFHWNDPKIWSGILMWAAYATLAHARSRSFLHGRWMMIFTIAAFALLLFALAGVDLFLPTDHGVPRQSSVSEPTSSPGGSAR